jgi:hypothetical protein
MHLRNVLNSFVGILGFVATISTAQADVFNAVHFVEPGKMAFGAEPVITMSHGAGIGANLDYIQGIDELMDAEAVIGTGTGPRRFRVGGGITWDFFPDIDKQPGIGLMTSAIYYRLPNDGQLVLTGAPYIHKAFVMDNKQEVEPFVAIPLGLGFESATYQWIGQFVFGSMFKYSDKIRYSAELGLNMNNAETYISAGITYYP